MTKYLLVNTRLHLGGTKVTSQPSNCAYVQQMDSPKLSLVLRLGVQQITSPKSLNTDSSRCQSSRKKLFLTFRVTHLQQSNSEAKLVHSLCQCQHDNGYIDDRSQILVNTDECTYVTSALFSMVAPIHVLTKDDVP